MLLKIIQTTLSLVSLLNSTQDQNENKFFLLTATHFPKTWLQGFGV